MYPGGVAIKVSDNIKYELVGDNYVHVTPAAGANGQSGCISMNK